MDTEITITGTEIMVMDMNIRWIKAEDFILNSSFLINMTLIQSSQRSQLSMRNSINGSQEGGQSIEMIL